MKCFLGMGDLNSGSFPVYNLQQPNDYIGWIARGKRARKPAWNVLHRCFMNWNQVMRTWVWRIMQKA